MPKKNRKYIKPVFNDNTANVKFQYDVKGSVERSKRVRYSEVFDTKKKELKKKK